MRKKLIVLLATGLSLVLSAGVALANPHVGTYGDRTYSYESTDVNGDPTLVEAVPSGSCIECHETAEYGTIGPHGGYTAQTNKCQTCHDVHVSDASAKMIDPVSGTIVPMTNNEQLLPGATLTAACNYCHDLTGSKDGPYNTQGLTTDKVNAAHRVQDLQFTLNYTDSEGHANVNPTEVDGITIIPGGNSADGLSGDIKGYTATTDYSDGSQGRLSGSVFTCDSCHTPHGVNTVKPYLGESEVKVATSGDSRMFLTTRLLKSHPNGAYNTADANHAATEYGSKWCMGCHGGRDEISALMNHPVNGTLKGYYFLEEAGMTPAEVDAAVVAKVVYIGASAPAGFDSVPTDPRTNKQYALTEFDDNGTTQITRNGVYKPYSDYKNLTDPNLNGPSCQMCHGSARDVEASFAPANPERKSFPHLSTNKALLVETGDDFCTNCHAPSMLP